jgi:hypothetical protein
LPTSKSTVVGVRLDHERRAWLEAEAARQGVTVRVLVERMIDQGRAGEETETPETAVNGDTESAPNSVSGNGSYEVVTEPEPADRDPRRRYEPWAGVVPITDLPGEVIRAGISLTETVIRSSGHFAVSTLGTWSASIPGCLRSGSHRVRHRRRPGR